MSGKPLPYKRRLSYIENTSTGNDKCWIKTIIPSGHDFKIVARVMKTTSDLDSFAWGATTFNGIMFHFNWYRNIPYFRYINIGDGLYGDPMEINREYDIEHGRISKISGKTVQVATTSLGFEDFKEYLYLFAYGRTLSYPFRGRIYNLKAYSDESLVLSLIPVISLDDDPCMYDEVSGKLFTNGGTGVFAYGELET